MNKMKYFIPLLLALFLVACGASALEKGNTAASEGDYAEAVTQYTAALAEDGASPADQFTALSGRAAAQNQLGNGADALTDYGSALTLTNEDGSPAGNREAVYRSRIAILQSDGDLAGAATEMRQLLSLTPQDLNLYIELGEVYAELEDWENMVASMTAALDIDPSNAAALTLRGTAYLKLREFELAITDLKASLSGDVASAEANTNLVDAYYELGQVLYSLDQPADSIANFTEALNYAEIDTDISRVRAERGFVYSETGDYDAALADFNEALTLNPSMAIVYSYRSYVYADLENYEAAIADADKAIELGSDLSDATRSAILHARASALANSGSFEEAALSASESIALSGENSENAARTFGLRSRIHRSLGDYQAALADAQKAIELGASDIVALDGFYYASSIANYYLENYEAALADQQASIGVSGEEPSAADYEYIGDIYDSMGDFENAVAAYQVAIQLDPEEAWYHNYLGDIYYGADDFASAEAEYRLAIEIDSTVPRFYDNLGYALNWQDRYEEAIAVYNTMIEVAPDSGVAWYGRGLNYYYLGMNAEAIADLQNAKTFDLSQGYLDRIDELISEMGG